MIYFVGLGNKSKKYTGTRHNIGMDLVEKFVDNKSFILQQISEKEKYICRKFSYSGIVFVTVKLLTYMNLSGNVLKILTEEEGIDLSQICIICDDFNLPFGSFRIRLAGSSGNHKGLQSIIDNFGTIDFARIRIGIGPLQGIAEEFVLQKFTLEEKAQLPQIFTVLCNIVEEILLNGYQKAMNKFNASKKG